MPMDFFNLNNIKQFIKYGIVGAGGTLAHYAFLIVLVNLCHANASLSALFGAFLGAVINYILNYKFTFLSGKKHVVALPQFIIVASISMILSAWVVKFMTTYELHYLIGQIAATALLLPIGFVVNKKVVF